MKADLGSAALYLALAAVVYSTVLSIAGIRSGSNRTLRAARSGLYAVFALLALASAALLAALLTNDFSLSYVASYTSRAGSAAYTIAGFWAGNAGSLLFWSLVLGVCGLVFALKNGRKSPELVAYVSIAVLATEALFLLLMIAVESPFAKLAVPPADGRGLNPLLENWGMLVHPTTLLAGYAGVTVPFGLALAALFMRQMDEDWLGSVRRWTLVFWLLLGVGNILGMQWAYVELGWGGYWAWDPVENAGLMPWLTMTAFLHSLMVQRRRGTFKAWNMALIGASFFLAIFGTFLTRSNILSSVHTFGESGMEPYFAFFMTAGIVLYTALVISRLRDLRSDVQVEDALFSRETGFAINNYAFAAVTLVVLLGTMSPLFSQLFTGNTITLGANFFNTVISPIFVIIVLLMGICPLLAWYRSSPEKLVNNLLGPTYAAMGTAIVLVLLGAFGINRIKPYAIITFSICAFAGAAIFLEWVRGTMARHRTRGESYVKAFGSLIGSGRARYGGYIVHLGVLLLALGIAGSSAYGVTREFTLAAGQSSAIQNYTLTFSRVDQLLEGDRTIQEAKVLVTKDGKSIGEFKPQRIFKENFPNPVTEVALRTGLTEDLYVLLTGTGQNAAAFKVLVNPLVMWIWIGGGILLLGSVIAFWPASSRRRRESFAGAGSLEREIEFDREMGRIGDQGEAESPVPEPVPEDEVAASQGPAKPASVETGADQEIELEVARLRTKAQPASQPKSTPAPTPKREDIRTGLKCPRCAAPRSATAKFCGKCGANLTTTRKRK